MTDPFEPYETASERMMREIYNSPAERLRREMEGSSVAKLARDLADSPSQRIARDAARALRPEADTAGTEISKLLACVEPASITSEIGKSFASARSLAFDEVFGSAIGRYKPVEIAPEIGRALAEAKTALTVANEPLGGVGTAFRAAEEQQRSLRASFAELLGGTIGNASRVNQWATALGRPDIRDVAKLLSGAPNMASQVSRIRESLGAGFVQPDMSAMLGLDHKFGSILDTTSFKMSAFASVTDVAGLQSPAWDEAYRSLFGTWRTRPDLPETYWHEPRTRQRMYDEAEVDPGLVEVTPDVAIEIMVESGLATGARSETGGVALFSFGEVTISIRSENTRQGAFALLSHFEEELRGYITSKLSEKFGPEWFELCVDGNTAGDAKRKLRQALERDETELPLIHYTELGDLSNIIKTKKNWEEVFGEVFINRDRFDHYMQTLIAGRRPTMHGRPVDAVRLAEMACVVERFARQMAGDGAWKLLADSDA